MGYKSNSYRRELKKAQMRRGIYLSKIIVLILHNIIARFVIRLQNTKILKLIKNQYIFKLMK